MIFKIFVFLLLSGATVAQALDRGNEVRLALTESGYNKLESLFSRDSSERVDIYFEAWQNEKFILKPQKWKLRLKQKTSKYELQVSQVSKSDQYLCGDIELGLNWTNEGRKTFELKSSVEKVVLSATQFFTNLRLLDPKAWEQVEFIDSFLKLEKFPGKKALEWDFSFEDLKFVPSKLNRKVRGKLTIKDDKDLEVEFVLGRTVDANDQGVPQIFYELEAEGSGEPEDAARVFCNLISEVHLSPTDVDMQPKPDATQLTLKLLNMLKK
jgi:hypothetical protein